MSINKLSLYNGIRINQWQRLIIGILGGIITGLLIGEKAMPLGYLGLIFLNLIKMLIVPMLFFTIIYGLTGKSTGADMKSAATKAIIAFMVTSIVAVIIGISAAKLIQPGSGINKDDIFITINKLKKDGNTESKTTVIKSPLNILLNLVPSNIFSALASENILQIILFSFFCGLTIKSQAKSTGNLITLCHEIAKIFFKMISNVMQLAPIGVFGYLASLVGTEGLTIIFILGKLVSCVLLACVSQYLFFGVLIFITSRLSPLTFYKKMLLPQLIALSTSSSKATLVPLMQTMEEKMGVSKQSTQFILPLASALNMDGGAIYHSVCALFFAQILGLEFSPSQYLTLAFMCTIASIGGAGIPGGVMMFLGMVLESVKLPIEGVLLIATIDRILDIITTFINVTGNATITLIIDYLEKKIDLKKYKE